MVGRGNSISFPISQASPVVNAGGPFGNGGPPRTQDPLAPPRSLGRSPLLAPAEAGSQIHSSRFEIPVAVAVYLSIDELVDGFVGNTGSRKLPLKGCCNLLGRPTELEMW